MLNISSSADMKIHIMGASCAGSTTLGKALSELLSYPYFDTDQFFWLPSETPFTVKREARERNEMLKQELSKNQNAITGGSLLKWGDEWLSMFDLVVFLYVPGEIRMERLKNREIQRYGEKIVEDPVRASLYNSFVTWAQGYDDNTTQGRNLQAHTDWLAQISCPVIRIEGDTTVSERTEIVLRALQDSKP